MFRFIPDTLYNKFNKGVKNNIKKTYVKSDLLRELKKLDSGFFFKSLEPIALIYVKCIIYQTSSLSFGFLIKRSNSIQFKIVNFFDVSSITVYILRGGFI